MGLSALSDLSRVTSDNSFYKVSSQVYTKIEDDFLHLNDCIWQAKVLMNVDWYEWLGMSQLELTIIFT